MHSSQGQTTSGRTFRVQLDVPRSLAVLLLLASFAEVRSYMLCSSQSDMTVCNYAGCQNGNYYNCNYALPSWGGPFLTCMMTHDAFGNAEFCPERPCPWGTFNGVSSCVSGGLGRGGGTICSCTNCPAGKYSNVTGSTACVDCDSGKFSDSIGATVCNDCPIKGPRLDHPPGSSDCLSVCGAGKYGIIPTGQTAEESCTPCGAGKYGVASGQTAEASACTDCPIERPRSLPGSVASSDCLSVCGAGKYGIPTGQTAEESCTPCGAGKYGVATQQTRATEQSGCLTCPPYSNSPLGSTSVTMCTCNTGSTGPNGGPCSQCVAGKFKVAPGTDACATCLVGKYGAATGAVTESECMTCPAGKFGGREGSSTCTDCTAGKVSDTGEVACREPTVVPVVTDYVVKLVLSLPLAKSEFTQDKQSKFRESIAAAAGAKPTDVTIDGIDTIITSIGRRLLSESVVVQTTITAADVKAGDAIASSLTTDRINVALQNAGLPNATIKKAPTVETVSTATSVNTSTAPLTALQIGCIVGGLVLLIVIIGALVYWRYLAKNRARNLAKNKARTEYNARFDTLDTNHDGFITGTEFAQSLLVEYKVSSAPFKFFVENPSGSMSRRQYEQGFELVEAFRDFEAGTALPLCLLLRAKYHESKVSCDLGQVNVSPVPEAPQTPKFCVRKLQVGSSALSARGLRSAVGLDDDNVLGNMLKDPEHTLECEILLAGDKDDIENFYSIKDGTSGNRDDMPAHVKRSIRTGKYHGGVFSEELYDTGNTGKKLKDFLQHETSVLARLVIWHVLVIRLYTSSSYTLFNAPLRSLLTSNGQTQSQHPLRFTVYMLTEGIKKLRAVEAERDPVGYNTEKELWRGMADMEVDVQGHFLSRGGTEMAVMSTTCDKEVALSYSRQGSGQVPLVFKYKTFGLSRGVSIQFLSLYPKEVEYLYPVPFQTSL
jgi:hypothetical protein